LCRAEQAHLFFDQLADFLPRAERDDALPVDIQADAQAPLEFPAQVIDAVAEVLRIDDRHPGEDQLIKEVHDVSVAVQHYMTSLFAAGSDEPLVRGRAIGVKHGRADD